MNRTLFLLPLLVGCAELQPFLPTVSFERMDVEDVDFEHIQADFVFQIDNPNPIQVGLSSFSWALALEEQDLLSGDNPDGFTLEASDGSELALPVDLGWRDAWDTVQATRGEDFVDFGLKGHFGFDTPIGEARIPYDEGGNFPALRTPKVRFDRVRVGRLDLLRQTASLELDLGVDNEHATTIFFDRFDYGVSLGGTEVAAGLVEQLGGVEGATEGVLTLPFEVNLLSLGTQVVSSIVNKQPIDVALDATVDVDTPFGVVPLYIDEQGVTTVH